LCGGCHGGEKGENQEKRGSDAVLRHCLLVFWGEEGEQAVDDVVGQLCLAFEREVACVPEGVDHGDLVRVDAETGARVLQGVEDDEVEALTAELLLSVRALVVRLECEAHEALIGILALEAYRAQALVVGEDLGTVEPWVREYLSRRGLLGTAILWWEYGIDGQVLPPEKWREYCMASVTTHDLPPTLGYLESGHVRLREQLGLLLEPVEQELAVAERERDMWVERLIAFGVLDEALAGDHVEVMLAMHRYLRLTNSKVLVASLADAAGEKRAQNQPGTMNEYPNWRVPLADSGGKSLKLEDLFTADLPRRVADVMNGDRQDS